MGIAPTRSAARQLVSHRHITVNGKVVNIPSFTLRAGDMVGVRERSKSSTVITESLRGRASRYPWLEWDESKMEGKFINPPARTELPETIKEQLIVELYSK
jgi:small subunit ribosomal protein S4